MELKEDLQCVHLSTYESSIQVFISDTEQIIDQEYDGVITLNTVFEFMLLDPRYCI